jgi:hypothetical protein
MHASETVSPHNLTSALRVIVCLIRLFPFCAQKMEQRHKASFYEGKTQSRKHLSEHGMKTVIVVKSSMIGESSARARSQGDIYRPGFFRLRFFRSVAFLGS